jgi:hypothetical protein
MANIIPLTKVSSYYNQSTTEDIWLYMSSSFYYSYFTLATSLVLWPEIVSPLIDKYCSGLTFTISGLKTLPFVLSIYTTGNDKVCSVAPININAAIIDEWFHVASTFELGKKAYYINQIFYGTVSHFGCQGAKYLFRESPMTPGLFARNYRVWSAKVDINFLVNNIRSFSLYGSLPPRHIYKFNEISGDVIDYGESGLNLYRNDLLRYNNFEEFIAVHESFPYASNFTLNTSCFHNGAVYLKDDILVIPNAPRLLVPVITEMSISFLFQMESLLAASDNYQILKSFTLKNKVEAQQLAINVTNSITNVAALKINTELNSLPLTNDISWKYVCLSLTEGYVEEDGANKSVINVFALIDNNIYSTNPSTSTFTIESSFDQLFIEDSMLAFAKFPGYARELKVWSKALSFEEFMSHLFILDSCQAFPYLISYWSFNNSNGNYTDSCQVLTLNTTQAGVVSRINNRTGITTTPIYFNTTPAGNPKAYNLLYKYQFTVSLPNASEKVPFSMSSWIYIRSAPDITITLINNGWVFVVPAADTSNLLYIPCIFHNSENTITYTINIPYKIWNYIGFSLTASPSNFSLLYVLI